MDMLKLFKYLGIMISIAILLNCAIPHRWQSNGDSQNVNYANQTMKEENLSESLKSALIKHDTMWINVNGTKLMAEPGLNSNILAHLNLGAAFLIENEYNDWYKGKSLDSMTGYVNKKYLSNYLSFAKLTPYNLQLGMPFNQVDSILAADNQIMKKTITGDLYYIDNSTYLFGLDISAQFIDFNNHRKLISIWFSDYSSCKGDDRHIERALRYNYGPPDSIARTLEMWNNRYLPVDRLLYIAVDKSIIFFQRRSFNTEYLIEGRPTKCLDVITDVLFADSLKSDSCLSLFRGPSGEK